MSAYNKLEKAWGQGYKLRLTMKVTTLDISSYTVQQVHNHVLLSYLFDHDVA